MCLPVYKAVLGSLHYNRLASAQMFPRHGKGKITGLRTNKSCSPSRTWQQMQNKRAFSPAARRAHDHNVLEMHKDHKLKVK